MYNSIKKYLELIKVVPKYKWFFYLLLSVLISLLEIVSITLIVPLIQIGLGSLEMEKISQNNLINYFLNNKNKNEIFTYILFLFVFLYIFKIFLYTYCKYFTYKILSELDYLISSYVLTKYLHASLSNINKQNISKYIRNITIEVKNLVSFTSSLCNLILESIIFIFIIIFLFLYFGIHIFIYALILILPILLVYNYQKKTFENLSIERQKTQKNILQLINDFFSSIEEIKIYKLENKIINKFNLSNQSLVNVIKNKSFYMELPRQLIEIIIIISFGTYFLFFYFSNQSPSYLIQNLSVLAIVGFRLMPSLNRIITSFQNLNYLAASVITIYNDYNSHNFSNTDNNKRINFEKSFEISKICFSYSVDKKLIQNFNFKINKNDKIIMSGVSGIGKSTILKIITGLIQPTSGRFIIDSKDIDQINKTNLKFGYVSQKSFLFDDTILNNIIFFRKNYSKSKLQNILKITLCNEFIDKLPDGINTKIGEDGILLSGGQIQRIAIARSLVDNPSILILDESTNSLDEEKEESIIKNLINLNVTLIFVSHKKKLFRYFKKTLLF